MLDSSADIREIDSRDMLGKIDLLPKHLSEGLVRGRRSGLPRFTPRNIVVCGMGGSAIGGDLLKEWLATSTDVSCEVCRSYSVPAYVGKDSLVIVASYSGNTEESLSMLEDAVRKRAKVATISSGGRLADLAGSHSLPHARIGSGLVPRSSLGFMFGAMVGVIERTGLAEVDKQFEETLRILTQTIACCKASVMTTDNPAKRLAHELYGLVPVVFGYGLSAPVSKRWANQMNENAKVMAFSSEIPEMDHNEIVGWVMDLRSQGFSAVFLEHEISNAALQRRVNATKGMIAKRTQVHAVYGSGLSPLAQMFSLVAIGDYVSAYLGLLRKEDPSSTQVIEDLKSILAKK